MLKLKNIVFLPFGVLALAAFFMAPGDEGLGGRAYESLPVPENGRVLGVQEDAAVPTADDDALAAAELPPMEPQVDKRDFAPLKKEGVAEPKASGGIAIVDEKSGKLLFGRDADGQRPIASITKLATALVLVDRDPDWDSYYEIKAEDRLEGGRVYVKTGERVRLKDLLYAGLVASDNTAMQALVSASGLDYLDFVSAMNRKAEDLGLKSTKFVDPAGLSTRNISTAREVTGLIRAAASNGIIRDCLLKQKYVFKTEAGVSKTINSTDLLLDDFDGTGISILGGKTGYTAAAGYCFTAMFEGPDRKRVLTAVLGQSAIGERFSETKRLVNWAFGAYEWRN